MRHWIIAVCLLFVSIPAMADGPAEAASPAVYTKTVDRPMDQAYPLLYEALEAENFWVVMEMNMGQRLAGMKERMGDAYNRSQLTGIRGMVFCNLFWTNRIANADPDMLGICPLSATLYEKDGRTTITMVNPAQVAKGSKAEPEASALGELLMQIVEEAYQDETVHARRNAN